MIEASRERELRYQKFHAAIAGIDMDKAEVAEAERRFKEVQDRVDARRAGKSQQEHDLNMLGFDYEPDE